MRIKMQDYSNVKKTIIKMSERIHMYERENNYDKMLLLVKILIDMSRRWLGEYDDTTLYVMQFLSHTYYKLNRIDDAIAAEKYRLELLKSNHIEQNIKKYDDIASSMWNIGCYYTIAGIDNEALAFKEETVKLNELNLVSNNYMHLWHMLKLSACYVKLGRLEDADALIHRVIELFKDRLKMNDECVIYNLQFLSEDLESIGRIKEAAYVKKLWDKVDASFEYHLYK